MSLEVPCRAGVLQDVVSKLVKLRIVCIELDKQTDCNLQVPLYASPEFWAILCEFYRPVGGACQNGAGRVVHGRYVPLHLPSGRVCRLCESR